MNGRSATAVRLRIAASGGLAILLILASRWYVFQFGPALETSPFGGLLIALKWLVLPALTLLASLLGTAFYRFTHGSAIDGRPLEVGHVLDILLRNNRNTLEQLALALIAWTGLSIAMPGRAAIAFPVLAMLFVLGRISFFVGYLIIPWARAFGFVLTFVPNAAILMWLALRLV